jgi:putative ABC transport system permease protein
MDATVEQSLFQLTGPNDIQVKLVNAGQRANEARSLGAVLAAHHVSVLAAQVGNEGDNTVQIVNGLFGVMRVLSIIALLLSIFLMLSTITTLIAEQLPIIGTMKAIGAQSGPILRNYLTSVAIYGALGTTIGLILGLVGGYALSSFMGNLLNVDIGPFSVTPTLILIGVGVGMGVPLLAAIIPIALGTRITVRQAMSGYGLDGGAGGRSGRSGKAGGVSRRVGATPQTIKLGARSLFRKRARAALTLLALAISGTAFLAVQTTSYSFDGFLTNVLGVYQADVWVGLTTPIPYSKAQTLLAQTPGVARSEPMASAFVQTHWGNAVAEGIAPNAQIYHHEIVSGRWFTASDQNVVVLSEAAARKTGLKAGDLLPFHDDLHSASWRVIGVTRDNNDLGLPLGVVLAPISQVTAFQRLPADYAETILLTSTDKHQSAIDALAARVDNTLSDAGYQASVRTTQQVVQANQSQFQIIYLLLYIVAVIIALVGAIGLFNTLAMSVLERRREIGILRSIGATGGKVAQVFWTEGVSLGVVAWAIAIVLGIPAAYGFVQLLGVLLVAVPFAFNPMSLVWMLAFVVVVATLASLGPVWGATRVKIAQTLRYE